MAYCRKCGAKVDSDDKFCPDCGVKIGAKGTQATKPVETKAAPVKTPLQQVGTAFAIVISIAVAFAIMYYVGVFDFSSSPAGSSCLENNPKFPGEDLCGYCPTSGKCTYCAAGTCPSDPCSSTCAGGVTGDGRTIAQQHCNPGYCYSGGHCCPYSARYYCNGNCYASSSDLYGAGCSASSITIYC
jgi:hypothetical protein